MELHVTECYCGSAGVEAVPVISSVGCEPQRGFTCEDQKIFLDVVLLHRPDEFAIGQVAADRGPGLAMIVTTEDVWRVVS